MILFKFLKAFSFVAVMSLFINVGVVGAQTQFAPPAAAVEYSDNELKQFANAYVNISVIQEESQGNMAVAIEESNISLDRFNEMLMQGQQGGEEAIEGTEEEMMFFQQALGKVQEMQVQMQTEMMRAIATEGLDVDKFQGIMQAYEQDSELREKVDGYFAQIQEGMME